MNVIVTNQTNGTIYAATVAHSWSGNNSSVGPQDLPNNGTMTFSISVGGGGSDDWSVGFTDGNGNQWYRNGKQCDVTSDDFDTGKPVVINLLPSGTGWSVELPSSSGCTDNSYSQGFESL
jgi:hypothetical protein